MLGEADQLQVADRDRGGEAAGAVAGADIQQDALAIEAHQRLAAVGEKQRFQIRDRVDRARHTAHHDAVEAAADGAPAFATTAGVVGVARGIGAVGARQHRDLGVVAAGALGEREAGAGADRTGGAGCGQEAELVDVIGVDAQLGVDLAVEQEGGVISAARLIFESGAVEGLKTKRILSVVKVQALRRERQAVRHPLLVGVENAIVVVIEVPNVTHFVAVRVDEVDRHHVGRQVEGVAGAVIPDLEREAGVAEATGLASRRSAVHEVAGTEIGQTDLITDGHQPASELQDAGGGQRADTHRGQRVVLRCIAELEVARSEHVGGAENPHAAVRSNRFLRAHWRTGGNQGRHIPIGDIDERLTPLVASIRGCRGGCEGVCDVAILNGIRNTGDSDCLRSVPVARCEGQRGSREGALGAVQPCQGDRHIGGRPCTQNQRERGARTGFGCDKRATCDQQVVGGEIGEGRTLRKVKRVPRSGAAPIGYTNAVDKTGDLIKRDPDTLLIAGRCSRQSPHISRATRGSKLHGRTRDFR